MENKIGTVIYRVEYRGVFSRYTLVGFKEDKSPILAVATITDFSNNSYKINEELKNWATCNFSIENALLKTEEFFTNYDEAKLKSIERYEKEVNPNGKYKVARYFDNVFESFVTGELSKNDALEKAKQLNRSIRAYVSYSIYSIS